VKAPRRRPAPTAKDVGNAAAARPAVGKPLGRDRGLPRPDARKAPAKVPAPQAVMQLHTAQGARKCLTGGERDSFLREAERADRDVRTLCMTLLGLPADLFKIVR
jgi:hypothetical protein